MKRCIAKLEVYEDMETGVMDLQGYSDLKATVIIAEACKDLLENASVDYVVEKFKKGDNE